MAGDSSVLKVGLVAAAGYLAYRQGWLSFLNLAPSLASSASSVIASTSSVPPLPSQLDALYSKMVAEAAKDGMNTTASVDAWDVYLTRAGGPTPAPAPEDVFGANPRASDMTALQYWAKMAPYLKAKAGLTGLGCYGDLACMACGGNW